MYMRQYAWRIIRISKEILQIFSHYFAESATRRRLPQAISKTCGNAQRAAVKKRPRKMEVGLTPAGGFGIMSSQRQKAPGGWWNASHGKDDGRPARGSGGRGRDRDAGGVDRAGGRSDPHRFRHRVDRAAGAQRQVGAAR